MKLLVKPYDYQQAGIEFAFARRYSINGDRMGLGKTLQALGLAVLVQPKKALVVCPSFLIHNWKAEIKKFLGVDAESHLFGLPDIPFDIVSYDSVAKVEICFKSYDLVICDEAHYLKNLEAKRTERLHRLVEIHRPEYFLALSGTPIKNRVPEFYSLLRLCWLGGGYPQFDVFSKSTWLFNREFTHQKTLKLGPRRITKFEGVRNVEALKALLRPIYIRRKAEDVLDLPEQVNQEVLIDDKSEADAALKQAWEAYEGKKQSKTFSSGKAVSALSKVSFTVSLAKEILESAKSVVIYTDHVQAAKMLHNEFDRSTARFVTGGTSVADRAKYVDEINNGDVRVLISTIGSLSVGVNLTGVNYMIFNDLPWVPADLEQAKKRIHRIGQKNRCFYYYVLASKVDQLIYRTLLKKMEIIAEVGT